LGRTKKRGEIGGISGVRVFREPGKDHLKNNILPTWESERMNQRGGNDCNQVRRRSEAVGAKTTSVNQGRYPPTKKKKSWAKTSKGLRATGNGLQKHPGKRQSEEKIEGRILDKKGRKALDLATFDKGYPEKKL